MATIFYARATRCRRPLTSHVTTLYMSWSREGGRSGPRAYHHGNLKEALIRAALELIAQKGPAGFTFAEAARWAGVSPAAPYRHFRDRDELLIDVARRGFDQFEVRARMGRRPSRCLHSLRARRQSLSPLCQERAGLLFRYVRGRHPARSESTITGSGAARLCRVADRHRAAHR